MSDETLNDVQDELPASLAEFVEEPEPTPDPELEPTPEPQPEPEPQPDPAEEKARASGWRPKEEWVAQGRDPDEWVDAGEFNRRKPLFEALKKRGDEAKELKKQLEKVAAYAARAEELGRKRAIEELEAKRLQAVEVGDTEAFKAADDQLRELEKQAPEPVEPEPAEPEIPEEIKDFAKRNALWFEKDVEMTEFSVERTRYYRTKGMPMGEALAKAEADVKRFYSDKFVNPNKEKPSPVAPNNAERRPARYGYNNLSAEQKAVFATLKNHMTLDEYIAGLKAQGELK